jgi:Mrp family chromosome partitioning ATPase
LAKESAQALFRTLRADYDFVVLDTGPVLAYADTMLMGNQADAAVLSILRDVSQIPKVYEARERLESIGLPVLGGVVGGVSPSGNRNYALLN